MNTQHEQFLLAIARIEKFSPAPLILARVRKLLRDANSDLVDVANLIGRDPALTADIIRDANSAYYGSGGVQDISGAIQTIGFGETINLLNFAVGRRTMSGDLGSYGISGDDFWAESLFNGLFLRNLATETGCADADEAYTVGLLRYIGRLAINQAIHDLGGGLFWFGDEPITQWELESTGFTQASAGALLLSKWQFPEDMVQAITRQDAPATTDKSNWLAEALYFASALLPQGVGASFHHLLTETAPVAPLGSDFMHHYGLSATAAQALVTQTLVDYHAIRERFGSGRPAGLPQ